MRERFISIAVNLAVHRRTAARASHAKLSHDLHALDLCGEFESCLYHNSTDHGVGSIFGKDEYVYKKVFHFAEILNFAEI